MTTSRTWMVLALAILVLFTHPGRAADSRWFGTWVLRPDLSHLSGPTVTIGRIPHGYHFNFGAAAFDVGDDGAFYPTVPTRETSLRVTGPRSWHRVHRVRGRDVDQSKLTLTPDESKLLIETVATSPTGKIAHSTETLDRVGVGTGLAGTWRSTSAGVTVERTIILSDAGAGRIRIDYPADGNFFVALPDGSLALNQGPRSVPNVALQLHGAPGGLRWTVTIAGKPFQDGADALTPDGLHLTEITSMASAPARRQIAVYDRR